MNMRYLRRLPGFDPVFGKGYGEEVDWCQKVKALGGTHVVQMGLFVEHKGGASFGVTAKTEAIVRNNRIVSGRYPKFDAQVHRFLREDPIRSARMIHALAHSCATDTRVPVYIAHSMGGGAEIYLRERLKERLDQGDTAIVLRVGGPDLWQVEHHSHLGVLRGSFPQNEDVVALLEGWPNLDIIYSCGVGHRDPSTLASLLCNLRKGPSRKLQILLHDYFCISEAYTLLDEDGRFTGVSPCGTRDREWRARWRLAIEQADEIRCFSHASARLMREAFPQCDAQLTVVPHHMSVHIPRAPLNPNGDIGVLGDIGMQKGANLVSHLTRIADDTDARKIVVVGRLDPAYALGHLGKQVGPYKRDQITEIAIRNTLACWLIPSIWPETFSYTTHEALATGLPVFVFDLGGQADAARAAPNGYVMPLKWADDPTTIRKFINGVVMDGANRRCADQSPQRRRRRGFAA